MDDNNSFDPRQWRRNSAGSSAGPVNPVGSATETTGADFWKAAAAEAGLDQTGPGPADLKAAPPRQSGPPRFEGRPLLAAAISLTLLGLTGLAAWLTRDEAASPAPARTDAPLAPRDEERAINLAGIGRLAAALIEAGVSEEDANAAASAAASAINGTGELRAILVLSREPGRTVLRHLHVSLPDGSGAVLARRADGTFETTPLIADLSREIKVLRGEIDSESFYTSAVSAGLVDAVIPEFINAFGYDFNLAAEISPGDVFEVAYDQLVNARGEPIGPPKLLYGLLSTPEKSLALYRFEPPGGEAGWFDGNGASTKRGLMRTPVDGARISSKFGMRFHPVLKYNRLHGGTDFAAPIGTPIYAAADAVVEFAAMKGANGNLTILRHDNGWRTYYLHQNVFSPGIAPGVRVNQGQHIGDVGTTGRSTGPHLHYEVHIDGERVDPLSIKTDDAERKRLEGPALDAFMRERDRIDQARARGIG
ncbi:MAG TPA: M23 family metallopeptidase [Novosphingobium sp.]|nr:M23 family metallopeptidase [Novosphingobium sp.]